VFGISEETGFELVEPPEHEITHSVTRLIDNTVPPVDIDISDPIPPPSGETDRVALVVRIHEADRKPVLTSDSAIYRRINDRKEPMSREQMESLFVEHDRKQQAIRQLEMEIDRFSDAIGDGIKINENPPDFHLLNIESLNQVLRENTQLYADEEMRETLARVFSQLRTIEDREVYFGRCVSGYLEPYKRSDEAFYRSERRNLKKEVSRLERRLEGLAEEANLNVKLLEE